MQNLESTSGLIKEAQRLAGIRLACAALREDKSIFEAPRLLLYLAERLLASLRTR